MSKHQSPGTDYASLATSHDLRLSPWGPYTTKYMGISHLPAPASGVRFDLSVFPALYRRGINVPNVLWESGYFPWHAAPDLSAFTIRHQLIWKDQLFADISYARRSEQETRIAARLVNRTTEPVNLALHLMASLWFPPRAPYNPEELRPFRVNLPDGGIWIDALTYTRMDRATAAPQDSLVPDAYIRGQVRDHGFTGGNGIALSDGDCLVFDPLEPAAPTPCDALVRYRPSADAQGYLLLAGTLDTRIAVKGVEDGVFPLACMQAIAWQPGAPWTLSYHGTGTLELDGLALVPTGRAHEVGFEEEPRNHVPLIASARQQRSLLLKYDAVPHWYGVAWDGEPWQVRQFFGNELDACMRRHVHNHVATEFRGPGEGHFTNIYMRPLSLEAGAEVVIRGSVCSGTSDAVEGLLEEFHAQPNTFDPEAETRAHAFAFPDHETGEPHRFGMQRMAASVLTSIVYPVHTRGTYIRNYSPGKWWDSLYTWDAGFIGIGLAELDLERAIDCLNAYVTADGDRDAAFIHHGSPVPVQIYLFQELWNRTQSRELLEFFYPRVRQYHRFLAGRHGSSSTRNLRSGLLRTWDYFYNSGGWDDYPPQVYVHEKELEASVAPSSNTSHAIRTAKILAMAARALGESTAEFEEDIATFTDALQHHAWDAASGYFGYVRHDADGNPTEILRHASGLNFNMGLDGIYPLVAGCCRPEQEQALLERLMSPDRLWTRWGVTTVDQSAPYYLADGYWNGAVWMAHQWFFWKTLLDLGLADDAWRIASTGLATWKREVDESYGCFEHFMVRTGRGAGWHDFGALSCPVLSWYGAYHVPGRLTFGLNVWAGEVRVDADARSAHARLHVEGQAHAPVIIATLKPGREYRATWNASPLRLHERLPGTLEITLPAGAGTGLLEVTGLPR